MKRRKAMQRILSFFQRRGFRTDKRLYTTRHIPLYSFAYSPIQWIVLYHYYILLRGHSLLYTMQNNLWLVSARCSIDVKRHESQDIASFHGIHSCPQNLVVSLLTVHARGRENAHPAASTSPGVLPSTIHSGLANPVLNGNSLTARSSP